MKNKKGLKYYFKLYLLLLTVYLGITVVMAALNDWTFEPTQLASVTYLPILFIVFLYVFDTIFGMVIKPKHKVGEEELDKFLKQVTIEVEKEKDFTIEDYRRLQENDRFQKALNHSFDIYKNGETKEMNLAFLEKKFKKDTVEGKAMIIVLDEVKKML
jgi:uncharacterized membrane protein